MPPNSVQTEKIGKHPYDDAYDQRYDGSEYYFSDENGHLSTISQGDALG